MLSRKLNLPAGDQSEHTDEHGCLQHGQIFLIKSEPLIWMDRKIIHIWISSTYFFLTEPRKELIVVVKIISTISIVYHFKNLKKKNIIECSNIVWENFRATLFRQVIVFKMCRVFQLLNGQIRYGESIKFWRYYQLS